MNSNKLNVDAYQVGQSINAIAARYKTQRTIPPARYDMATILDAMLMADKFAKNDADKKILQKVEGIGTSRTRQSIVQGLVDKELLQVEKRGRRHELRPNGISRQLRDKIPPILCDVSMTAKFELSFSMIERGEVEWRQVVDRVYLFVQEIIDQAKLQKGAFSLDAQYETKFIKRRSS